MCGRSVAKQRLDATACQRPDRRCIRAFHLAIAPTSIVRSKALLGDGRGQLNAEALCFGFLIDAPADSNVVRNHPGRMKQDPFHLRLTPWLFSDDYFTDVGVELRLAELAGVDHVAEFPDGHVAIPVVDDDLVEFRPAGRVHFAPRQRDEGRSWLDPMLATYNLGQRRRANGDIRLSYDLFDPVERSHGDSKFFRPFARKCCSRLGPARRADDLLEAIELRQTAQAVLAHGANTDETKRTWRLGPKPFQRDDRGSGAADSVGPMLVDDGNRMSGSWIRENDIACAIQPTDGIDQAIVVI